MTILCALLNLLVAILVTTITSLYDLTIVIHLVEMELEKLWVRLKVTIKRKASQ